MRMRCSIQLAQSILFVRCFPPGFFSEWAFPGTLFPRQHTQLYNNLCLFACILQRFDQSAGKAGQFAGP